ncbi:Lrp/AsnC family transcriptional regulator (plasmid) [Rhizobium sp. CB3060]|uniref:Lrp/AsnC family transcriptional regulator n=2 Tax=Rhizobium TaxID=379 RepID=UPI0003839CAD|nr:MULTISPECIES: Lrp/AsnC family transcriptional regulator [Rhizobium]AGS24404.1 AsnC family transcriptional regulator protein [Rhizobium etli bv. mimosae str. Mim1]UWU25534.1 Lrp/AsnC family transcriptional regulator [Rhizobium tropici]
MDSLDHRMIAELRINGRASVPQLAQILGVSRVTAQRRLDRLIENGDIRGFTVRLRDEVRDDQLRAVMLIEFADSPVKGVIAAIKRIPGIAAAYNTNGTWDVIAEVEVSTMSELNALVTAVRSREGVAKSETFIILGPA